MTDDMPLIYVAHPFGGDITKLDAAEAWVAYLCRNFPAMFWAPCIPLCRHWPDSGESRKHGLELDLSAVRRSDGVILVGGEVSPGMKIERNAARSVFDWTEFRTLDDFESRGLASREYEANALNAWLLSLTSKPSDSVLLRRIMDALGGSTIDVVAALDEAYIALGGAK